MRLHSNRSAEGRWAALRSRDRAADGSFFYAVRTTGIFCRPSCPSRQPRRENVEFYDTAAAALAAGYRACRRCRPLNETIHPHAELVRSACERMTAAEEPPPIGELAAGLGVSAGTLRRAFQNVLAMSPRQFAAGMRSRRLGDRLRDAASVTEAVFDAGYGSLGRAYEGVEGRLGMRPAARLRGGAGQRIRHAVVDSGLGPLLVAATERGICSIRFGDSAAQLEEQLASEFPRAEHVGADAEFGRWVQALIDWLDRPAPSLALPLDLQGTAFQIRVWDALRHIPAGETRSYGQVAAGLGAPRSVRAVARACASNPVALAVPCHRVVAADGGLAGYRWGLERKAALLERERDARALAPRGAKARRR